MLRSFLVMEHRYYHCYGWGGGWKGNVLMHKQVGAEQKCEGAVGRLRTEGEAMR